MVSFVIFGIVILINTIGSVSANSSEKCIGTMWDEDNRDFNKPQYPPPEVLPLRASNIVKAHEILRKGLQQLMQRMGKALGYRCHPCTPYKRLIYCLYTLPSTDSISADIGLEEILILCKNYDHQGQFHLIDTTTATSNTPSPSTPEKFSISSETTPIPTNQPSTLAPIREFDPHDSHEIKEMPTNFKDLQLLGHTLNGLYLVKATQPDDGTKIETVFCDFKSLSDLNGRETRVGVVNVKSYPVHFSVEGGFQEYGVQGENVIFDKEIVNIGNGFDWKNQWFVAPYPGTYFFSISGTKHWTTKNSIRASVVLKLNGELISEAVSSDSTTFGGFSSQFSRKLNANDKIEVSMFSGKFYLLYFTGWLQEENLTI